MINQKVIRAAYYLRVSTETQELDNQRGEIMPFIERRGWKLVHPFEDVMSGRKTEKDRPGFAAMLKAAHQRKFDIVVFWALGRLTRESTRADVLLHTRQLDGTWDRNNPRLLGKQPRERDLSGYRLLPFGMAVSRSTRA